MCQLLLDTAIHQLQLRERRSAEVAAREKRSDPEHMQKLRKKFLQTALTYIGVPYARKYHEPDCEDMVESVIHYLILLLHFLAPTHHSPLFLDCCGLVRRVLRDMKEDLGFTAGPWNQAYQVRALYSELHS